MTKGARILPIHSSMADFLETYARRSLVKLFAKNLHRPPSFENCAWLSHAGLAFKTNDALQMTYGLGFVHCCSLRDVIVPAHRVESRVVLYVTRGRDDA